MKQNQVRSCHFHTVATKIICTHPYFPINFSIKRYTLNLLCQMLRLIFISNFYPRMKILLQ